MNGESSNFEERLSIAISLFIVHTVLWEDMTGKRWKACNQNIIADNKFRHLHASDRILFNMVLLSSE